MTVPSVGIRVTVPAHGGIRSHAGTIPIMFLGPGTIIFGYFDPLCSESFGHHKGLESQWPEVMNYLLSITAYFR